MSDKDKNEIRSFLKKKMHGERESAQILQKEVEEWQKFNQRKEGVLHEQYEEKKSFLGKLLRWDNNKEKRKKKDSEKIRQLEISLGHLTEKQESIKQAGGSAQLIADLSSKAERLAQELANLRARLSISGRLSLSQVRCGLEVSLQNQEAAVKKQRSIRLQISPRHPASAAGREDEISKAELVPSSCLRKGGSHHGYVARIRARAGPEPPCLQLETDSEVSHRQ
eukprot:747745-Hanusia_phi.AAC.2